MIKMLIQMDKAEIERENLYDTKKIDAYFEKMFQQMGSYRDAEGYFVDGTFETFGAIVWHLSRQSWFLDNVSTWLWLNSDSNGNPDVFEVEDILSVLKLRRNQKNRKGAFI